MANARLGWLSPLGVAASIRAHRSAVGLRAHCFRFSACTASEIPLGEFVLPPSASEIALGGLILPPGGLAFGLTASAFRYAPLRSGRWASSFFRLPLRRLPLGGLPFGFTASAFRHASLRSGCWASSFFRLPLRRLPLSGLLFGFTASAFRHAPLRSGRWASWFFRLPLRSGPLRVGLRVHRFRFSARTDSEWPLGEFVLPLGGLGFGLTASAFRHAPIRSCRSVGWFFCLPLRGCPRRVGLRAHGFRFSARTASGLPLGGLVLLPSASELPLGELTFGLTASAFRHAPLRDCHSAG